jgi:hypothetical protein
MIGTLTTMLILLGLSVAAVAIPYVTVNKIEMHEIRAG